MAFRSGTNLDLRIALRGPAAIAHAAWAPPDPALTNFQHRFAALAFGQEKRSARRVIDARANRLPVHDSAQWRRLLGQIFTELAPAGTNHAILLLLPTEDLALYHDDAGVLRVVRVGKKPPNVVVDGTCDGPEFAERALRLLQAEFPSGATTPPRQFFFETGSDPLFVLLDAQERLIVFLGYGGDPETEAAPLGFAVRVLNSLVLRSLVLSAIKNPFTLVGRGLWHLTVSGGAAINRLPEIPSGPPPPLADNPPMDLAAWDKYLDAIVSSRRYKGRLDLLIDGDQFFPALLQSVANATRGIDVQVFIFDTDDYGLNIADLLKSRSSFVRVRVLLDSMGSLFAAQVAPSFPLPPGFQRPPSILSYLRQNSRLEARATANPWLTVDHRKCFIIDRREAYIGGMNIGRAYRYDWHDLMVRLTGPIVGRVEKDFRLAWAHAGPLGDFAYFWAWLFDRTAPRRNAAPGSIDLRPLRTATGKTEVLRAQLAAIQHARRYIYIETPYFDDASCLRALAQARQRGVDVRVIFPAHNDSGLMQLNDALVADDMIRAGIRVYAYPGMTHVKAAIYDGWACLGSANFDKMSLRVAQEFDVSFTDPAAVERLDQQLFEKDFARSHEIKKPGETSWVDTFVRAFTDQL